MTRDVEVDVLLKGGDVGDAAGTGQTEAGLLVAATHKDVVEVAVGVYLAGPEQAVADAAHKPDEYLTAKIDAIAALSTLLTRLGA